MLIQPIHKSLDELIGLLIQLSNDEYAQPCSELSNATIGEHTRHIIEMFQCLENNYESGVVNYDKRDRNILMQTNVDYAAQKITEIKDSLGRPNKTILLKQSIDGNELTIESNYMRELLYNLEHCIHHQALIKVALLKCATVTLSDDFGVARATIEYRRKCAQ